MTVDKILLHIDIYGLICGNVTLQIHETVVTGLQGVSETIAPKCKRNLVIGSLTLSTSF